MPEGKIIEFLSGEDGRDETSDGETAAAALDPSAAAAAMDMAKSAPALATEAAAYFAKQRRLVEIQTEHLHEQRRIALSHLKIRRFTDRLKAGTQLLIVVLSLAFTIAALSVVYAAMTSQAVVVDAFRAPPALAARGLSGDVVAGGILDALLRLQGTTRSAFKGLYTRSAWADEVKIEVPETGVSFGEIDQMLRERLGHDLHMGGDLVLTAQGSLALTVRGDGVPARTFQGPTDGLETLSVQAAEYLYGRSQPLQFATYLVTNGRSLDAIDFIPGALVRAGDDASRAWLARMWGNGLSILGRMSDAIDKYRLAVSFKPDDWASRSNIISAVLVADGEEAAWRESEVFLRAAEHASPGRGPALSYKENSAILVMDLPLYLSANLADEAINRQGGTSNVIDGPVIADTYQRMHDVVAAKRYLSLSDSEDSTTKAEIQLFAGQQALARGDPSAALAPLTAFVGAWKADPNLRIQYNDSACLLGLAQGLTGEVAAAEDTFRVTGDYARCFAMHGEVLENAGDLAGAERVWNRGLVIDPDLSQVYLQRGISELRRGDFSKAEADLLAANARSPHFADPLKYLGDLYVRLGRLEEAARLYDQALLYAPSWPELLQARAMSVRQP